MPSSRQASRIVWPSDTSHGARPSISSSTMRARRARPAASPHGGLLLRGRRAGRSPTRSRSTPSGRGRRSRRRACTGRSREQGELARRRRRACGPRAAARAPPPGARCRRGRGRTGRTTRRGRRRRSASGCAAGRPCRRRPSRRPSRACVLAARAPSKVSGRSSSSGPHEAAGRAAEQHGLQRAARRHAAGQLEQLARASRRTAPRRRRAARRCPETQKSLRAGRRLACRCAAKRRPAGRAGSAAR